MYSSTIFERLGNFAESTSCYGKFFEVMLRIARLALSSLLVSRMGAPMDKWRDAPKHKQVHSIMHSVRLSSPSAEPASRKNRGRAKRGPEILVYIYIYAEKELSAPSLPRTSPMSYSIPPGTLRRHLVFGYLSRP